MDAGPLVAYIYRRDQYHGWAQHQMANLATPLYTCEPVLSEAFHLLEDAHMGARRLVTFLRSGAAEVQFSYVKNTGRIHQLLLAYADQPMSFADACLVRMAEIHPGSRVFTTDRHFHIYRKQNGNPIDVVSPDIG